LATYFVEAAPVGAAEEAAETAALVALVAVEAALEVAARLVVMLEEALEEEAELEVVRGAEEDPEELEAPVVAAPPGVDEPELVKLCPMQLVSVPDWMGSSLE